MVTLQLTKGKLAAKALVRLFSGFLILATILFLPAGTTRFWQAWAYVAIIFTSMVAVFIYLIIGDPELLVRRIKSKEHDPKQKRIIRLGSFFYFFTFAIPGLDRRFEWSHLPYFAVILADVFVLVGYIFFLFVLRENRFASRVIEVDPEQKVVTTGPYAFVRHPMYLAILIIFLSTPLALGSWWALIPASGLIPILVVRINFEEKFLSKELPGYCKYSQTTKFRLLPGIW